MRLFEINYETPDLFFYFVQKYLQHFFMFVFITWAYSKTLEITEIEEAKYVAIVFFRILFVNVSL